MNTSWRIVLISLLLHVANLVAAQSSQPGRPPASPALVAQMRAAARECRELMHKQEFTRRTLPRYQRALRLDQQVGNDSLMARHAYLTGICYTNLNRFDSAAALLRQGVRGYLRQQDYGMAVAAAAYLSDAYTRLAHPDSTRALRRRLEAVYPRTRPSSGARVKFDEYLAGLAQDEGDYAGALRYYLAVVAYRRLSADTANTGISLINVGEVLYLQNHFRKALTYRQEGLRWLRLDPDMTGLLPEVYAMIGKTYRELGRLDSARMEYETALHQLTPTSDPDLAANLHAELGMVLGQQGNVALARQHTATALARYAHSDDRDGRCQAYFYAGDVELRAGAFGAARRYLRQAYDLALQMQNKDRYEAIFRQLAQAEAGVGHYAEAYRLRERAAGLLDSAHAVAGQQAVAEMEARYQNRDKQRQISQLDHENQLRQAEAAAQRRAKYLAFSAVAALLLVVGLIGYLLRQRQRTAALLAHQNAALAEANRTKTKLFSIVSHDLRAPVSNLFQLLELSQKAPHLLDEATRQQQTAHLRQTARDLLDTMEELLAWSKDQLDHLDPVPETVALPATLQELSALYQPLAQRKAIRLTVACPPGLTCRTDPNFLRVVLRNLVQNALKFTPEGGEVHLIAANEGGAVRFEVADTGPGLDAAQLARLLAAEGAELPATDPAHGLGLRLTREFVAKLGGTLTATSTVGAGSVFTVMV